jgi:hypothetical protein
MTDTQTLTDLDLKILRALRLNDASDNRNGLTAVGVGGVSAHTCNAPLHVPIGVIARTLRNLEKQGLINSIRPTTPEGRRLSRQYRLTAHGLERTKQT